MARARSSETTARKKRQTAATATTALVLADSPERARLRELQTALSQRRDTIAELELELETLRDRLGTFEAQYRARLAAENGSLERIERLVTHFDRWRELLADAKPKDVAAQAKRLDARRARELDEQREQQGATEGATEGEADAPPAATPNDRLKAAYRALARRYHPDLARTEDERVKHGDLMARINGLYKAGDLDRLEQLAEQLEVSELDETTPDPAVQVEKLEERLRWFDTVLHNLRDERVALEQSSTCELWRNVEQAAAAGRDLIVEIQSELRERVDKSYAYVGDAARGLEADVSRFNRDQRLDAVPKGGALDKRFDPFANKRLVRLGLDELRDLHVSREAKALADELEPDLTSRPGLLRLLLLAYVAELSPFPLPGLESYDDLALRLEHLAKKDASPLPLERALVEADTFVEYGVRRATEKVVHMGLRFRSVTARDAVPVLLKSIPIRREFKRILGVLGERVACPSCAREVFAVPLFKTHGLDDLRANVCPKCGHTLASYWMPKGKDVQAVLNAAFLDFELIIEFSFALGRGHVAMQFLPLQIEKLNVGQLRQRLYDDVLKRYGVEIEAPHVQLVQTTTRLAEKLPVVDLAERAFTVRFAPEAEMKEGDVLEMIRHRVRTRFQTG